MPTFLTVKEAAELTGKSSSSIRRIIYPIIQNDKHTDRSHIQPAVDEVRELRLKGENFAWRLSEELLRREIPADAPGKGTGSQPHQQATDGNSGLLEMLRRELDIKNAQIMQQSEMLSRQMELISGLTERLGEGNVLIGSLQRQLTLPESAPPKSNIVDTKSATTPTEKGNKKSTKVAKPKRGLFRLFR